jgi:hydrogenase maturation factor HypF (carbamoyltransferase family)
MELLLCTDCESPHFLVRWDRVNYVWIVCCEGCGAIYELVPMGRVQLRMKGIDQS